MDKVWWNQITNASRLIHLTVDYMLEGKSVMLLLPKRVPWYGKMCEIIESELKRQNSSNTFDVICNPQDNPGRLLLHKYCSEEKIGQYRPGKSYARFLADSEDIVLNNKYIWVQNIPDSSFGSWVEFVAEYALSVKTTASHAVFLLESREEKHFYKCRKGITAISFQSEIGSYDIYTFCALSATAITCRDYMRPYLAQLVCDICREDVELCAECVKLGHQFLENPIKMLEQVITQKCRSNGESYSFTFDQAMVEKQIWKTQIKIIFPMIENYRSYFVDRYQSKIQRYLPISSTNGELFTEPSEVEIGTLNYMAAKGQITINDKERNYLFQFKKARNTLAHLKTLKLQEVEELLGIGLESA